MERYAELSNPGTKDVDLYDKGKMPVVMGETKYPDALTYSTRDDDTNSGIRDASYGNGYTPQGNETTPP